MIVIRKYKREDACPVATIISSTYSRFNANEGTRQAVQAYVDHYRCEGKTTEEIHRILARTPHRFVAVVVSRIVGILRGRENRVVNLFVDRDCHRQGIATRLMEMFEAVCRKAGYTECVLRSSLYAIRFYESVGYKKTTGVRNLHGLKIQPMKKQL